MTAETAPSRPMRMTTNTVGDYLDRIGKVDLLTAEEEIDLAKQMEAGTYASHLLEEDENNELDSDYRSALGRVAYEGVMARQHMIAANTKLVVSFARKFDHNSNNFGDLIEYGNLGLIDAVGRFDHTKGFRFSTFAGYCIKNTILKNIYDNEREIYLPRRFHETHSMVSNVRRKHLAETGKELSAEAIAEQLNNGLTAKDIVQVDDYFASTSTISDNTPTSSHTGNVQTIADIIVHNRDEHTKSADDLFNQKDLAGKISHLISSHLDDRSAKILHMFMGLHGKPLNNLEIGQEIGVSRQRASQLVHAALKKLRSHPDIDSLKIYLNN